MGSDLGSIRRIIFVNSSCLTSFPLQTICANILSNSAKCTTIHTPMLVLHSHQLPSILQRGLLHAQELPKRCARIAPLLLPGTPLSLTGITRGRRRQQRIRLHFFRGRILRSEGQLGIRVRVGKGHADLCLPHHQVMKDAPHEIKGKTVQFVLANLSLHRTLP